MSKFWAWLAASPWASWFQAFAAIVVAGAVADWATGRKGDPLYSNDEIGRMIMKYGFA